MAARSEEPAVQRLRLPQVTLCAATSVNVVATLLALKRCLAQVEFAACKLFVDQPVQPDHPEIEVVRIEPLRSSAAYSGFILSQLADHVQSSHALVVQWDGHVLDASRWRDDFLAYDYIGASWPQFADSRDVGNGGFSLRSRRLTALCQDDRFIVEGPEDVAICRTNRDWLEQCGMRFAPAALADLFAAERAGDVTASFGYHGAFNMPRALGARAFAEVYRQLDERSTIWHDVRKITTDLARQPGGLSVAARIAFDHLLQATRSRR